MNFGSGNTSIVIGEGSDFNITWVDDFTILKEIESLLDQINIALGYVARDALSNALDPKVRYCLDRCDSSIRSASELIEAFAFLDATIFHNRQMHASLRQKITIRSDKSEEFILYLSCLRDALSTLLNTKDGTAVVSPQDEV
tara:strand:+ start:111 stop:536 length:426 start_codon:yes stop_codon:yes gene_type:complete